MVPAIPAIWHQSNCPYDQNSLLMQVFNKENPEGKLLVLIEKFAQKNRQLSFELPTNITIKIH